MAQPPHRSRRRFLAWLPAALVVSAGIVTSLGISLIPSATATTNTSNVDVTATVLAEVHVANGCTNLVSVATIALNLDDTSLGTCAVTFGSNNAAVAATLTVKDANADGTFFCTRTSTTTACTGTGSFPNAAANVANMADGAFGARRTAHSNCGTVPAAWSGSNYNPIIAAGTTVCTDTANGAPDGSFTFEFAADSTASQAAGDYKGRAVMEATAS